MPVASREAFQSRIVKQKSSNCAITLLDYCESCQKLVAITFCGKYCICIGGFATFVIFWITDGQIFKLNE